MIPLVFWQAISIQKVWFKLIWDKSFETCRRVILCVNSIVKAWCFKSCYSPLWNTHIFQEDVKFLFIEMQSWTLWSQTDVPNLTRVFTHIAFYFFVEKCDWKDRKNEKTHLGIKEMNIKPSSPPPQIKSNLQNTDILRSRVVFKLILLKNCFQMLVIQFGIKPR